MTNKSLALLELLRPRHWFKNVFCFAGVIFGGYVFQLEAQIKALATFAVFSLSASVVYIINDIFDRKKDRRHPVKQNRPIPSGRVGLMEAAGFGLGLVLFTLYTAIQVHDLVFVCVVLYLLNNLAYSFHMKNIPLIDVFSVALGFVLRVLAGIYVLNDMPTAWIVLCTFFLALFLAIAKRRHERTEIDTAAADQRPVLKFYRLEFLDHLLNSTALMTIFAYSLFTVTSNKNAALVITIPVVFYGIVYYTRLVLEGEGGDQPELLVFKEKKIIMSVIIWVLLYVIIAYTDPKIFI